VGGCLGKLKAAARWLVTPADAAAGTGQDAEDDAALRELSVSEEEIAAGRAALDGPVSGAQLAPVLWAWHADAARLFGAMRRQWLVVAGAQRLLYLGLNYAALGEVRRMLRIKPSPELMDQLHTMAEAGATALNDLQE
jgi:hypothetical protein